jgi:hypothetical protein
MRLFALTPLTAFRLALCEGLLEGFHRGGDTLEVAVQRLDVGAARQVEHPEYTLYGTLHQVLQIR